MAPIFPPMPSHLGPPSILDALPSKVHVPRADRTSRQRAIAALVAYLEKHRDIRIGQAVSNALGVDDTLFYVEDDTLAESLEASPTGGEASDG